MSNHCGGAPETTRTRNRTEDPKPEQQAGHSRAHKRCDEAMKPTVSPSFSFAQKQSRESGNATTQSEAVPLNKSRRRPRCDGQVQGSWHARQHKALHLRPFRLRLSVGRIIRVTADICYDSLLRINYLFNTGVISSPSFLVRVRFVCVRDDRFLSPKACLATTPRTAPPPTPSSSHDRRGECRCHACMRICRLLHCCEPARSRRSLIAARFSLFCSRSAVLFR